MLKISFMESVDEFRPTLREISEFVFHHPEIGFQEFQTSNYLVEILQKHQFHVKRNVANLPTAFHARKGDGGLRIGLLCEYDAVSPSLGHACGHNMIAASSVGAALLLAELTDEYPFSIEVFGTPAEEEGGGKAIMADARVFEGVDVVYYIHPSYSTRIGGRSLATRLIEIEVFGTTSHAARAPEQGRNALQAIMHMFGILDSERQHLPQTTKWNGVIVEGGDTPSSICPYAKAKVQLFSLTTKELEEAYRVVERVVKGVCLATNTTFQIKAGPLYLPRLVNKTLARVMEDNLRAIGLEVEAMPEREQGYTDVGNVSHVVPTVQGYISLKAGFVRNHTKEFRDLVISEKGHEAVVEATKVMGMTAIDLIQSPSLVKEIRAEFLRAKKEER